jgi:hypothetical protein
MSISRDFALLLQERGHGIYDDEEGVTSTIFLGELPSDPVTALAIAPYAGAAGNVRTGYDVPRIQIAVRADSYLAAEIKATEVFADIIGVSQMSMGDYWLILIAPLQSGPVWIRTDTPHNSKFVVNVELHVHKYTEYRR